MKKVNDPNFKNHNPNHRNRIFRLNPFCDLHRLEVQQFMAAGFAHQFDFNLNSFGNLLWSKMTE
jgi:hypothetical protein